MKLRTLSLFLVLYLALGTIPSVLLAQDEGLPDLGGREIKIAVDKDYPPFCVVTDEATGAGYGWDYDAFEYICERLNCTPTFVLDPIPPDELIDKMAAGEYDLSGNGITINDERAQKVAFSESYMDDGQVLLTVVFEERFADPEAFKADAALKLGAQAGSTSEPAAVEFVGQDRVVLYDLPQDAIAALIGGESEISAVMLNQTIAANYLGLYSDVLRQVGGTVVPEMLGLVFSPGSDLVEPFNAVLAEMEASGYMDYLYNKWMVHFPAGTELPDLEGREVVIATENAYPPFSLIDPNTEQAIGWDYDAFNYMCWLLNCTPVYAEAGIVGLFEAIQNGEYDTSGNGLTISPIREELVDFSVPYMNYGQVLVGRIDEARYEHVDAFAVDETLRLGVERGTTNELTAFEVVGPDRLDVYDSSSSAVQDLIAGAVDAVIMDSTVATGYVAHHPDAIKVVGTPFTAESLGFPFQKGSDLVEPFNAAIGAMQTDGMLYELYIKWFEEYEPPAVEAVQE